MAKANTIWLNTRFWALALVVSVGVPMLAMGAEVIDDGLSYGVGIVVGATFPLVVRVAKTRSLRQGGDTSRSAQSRDGLPGLLFLAAGIAIGAWLGSFAVAGLGFIAGFCFANLQFQFTGEAKRQRQALRSAADGTPGQGR